MAKSSSAVFRALADEETHRIITGIELFNRRIGNILDAPGASPAGHGDRRHPFDLPSRLNSINNSGLAGLFALG